MVIGTSQENNTGDTLATLDFFGSDTELLEKVRRVSPSLHACIYPCTCIDPERIFTLSKELLTQLFT